MAPRAASPRFAVLIPAHRRPELLRRTLRSVQDDASRSGREDGEVVVVENGVEAGCEAVCREVRGALPVRYRFSEPASKGEALNRGLAELAAPLVLFTDDDCRVGPGFLDTYLEAAERYGEGHHFGGRLEADCDTEPPEWLHPWLSGSAVGWSQGDREKPFPDPYFLGANWAAYRASLEDAGGFSTAVGPGSPAGALGSETEMQRRLIEAGSRGIYLPGAVVHHHVDPSCYTWEWARERNRKAGVSHALTVGAARHPWHGASPFMLRLYGLFMATRVRVARALGVDRSRRVGLEMRYAELQGYREGRARREEDAVGGELRRRAGGR